MALKVKGIGDAAESPDSPGVAQSGRAVVPDDDLDVSGLGSIGVSGIDIPGTSYVTVSGVKRYSLGVGGLLQCYDGVAVNGTSGGTLSGGFRANFGIENGTFLCGYDVNGGTAMVGVGGRTSDYPGLKNVGTTLQCRLADDSGLAGFSAAELSSSGPVGVGAVTVGTLPTPGFTGRLLFAVDGRNSGEASGEGTGALVVDDGTSWRVVNLESGGVQS